MKHGNEDTVREMLRIKRSVQAMYNTQVCTVLQCTHSCMLSIVFSKNAEGETMVFSCVGVNKELIPDFLAATERAHLAILNLMLGTKRCLKMDDLNTLDMSET